MPCCASQDLLLIDALHSLPLLVLTAGLQEDFSVQKHSQQVLLDDQLVL